jgi:1-acyl-sn-glycerol-3-phosphate acyltransferase
MVKSTLQPKISKPQAVKFRSQVVPWLTRVAYLLADKLIFPWFFRKVKIRGQENVPLKGAVIIAPTHRSRWDALIVPYATGRMTSGRDPHFMVSANEIKGIQGWFIRRLGGFPVDTQNPALDSLHHSVDLLCQSKMIVIFPEGRIFRTDEVRPLKRGVAKIALEVEKIKPEVEIKILPVSIKYSEPFPHRGCSVSVNIGSCLNVKDYQKNSSRQNSFRLTADLYSCLRNIHKQNLQE